MTSLALRTVERGLREALAPIGKPRVMMERLHPPPHPTAAASLSATTTADMPACRLSCVFCPISRGIHLQPFAAMSEREGLQHARAIRRQLEHLQDSGAAARLIIDAKELRNLGAGMEVCCFPCPATDATGAAQVRCLWRWLGSHSAVCRQS